MLKLRILLDLMGFVEINEADYNQLGIKFKHLFELF